MYLHPAVERNLQVVSHISTTGNMDNQIRHMAFSWEADLSFLAHLNFIQNRNKQMYKCVKIKLLPSQYTVSKVTFCSHLTWLCTGSSLHLPYVSCSSFFLLSYPLLIIFTSQLKYHQLWVTFITPRVTLQISFPDIPVVLKDTLREVSICLVNNWAVFF